jgi:MoxR-like ATPase
LEQDPPAVEIEPEANLKATTRLLAHGRGELNQVIAGQTEFIDQALIAILCHGHALVEGVPGIAKTLVVKLLARVLGVEFHRVQSTPDLMPGDIIGTSIFRPTTQEFALHRGPVFTSFLLVDEINRMPPRTQAALLECMEERQVTIDGVSHSLPDFFTVFATQNPIDFEGTYPLPEAQLDRFLIKLRVNYPAAQDERTVLERHHENADQRGLESITLNAIPADLLPAAQREIRGVRIEPALFDYILSVVRRTREWPMLILGASPRAAVSLMLVSQAYAALDGRDFLIPSCSEPRPLSSGYSVSSLRPPGCKRRRSSAASTYPWASARGQRAP